VPEPSLNGFFFMNRALPVNATVRHIDVVITVGGGAIPESLHNLNSGQKIITVNGTVNSCGEWLGLPPDDPGPQGNTCTPDARHAARINPLYWDGAVTGNLDVRIEFGSHNTFQPAIARSVRIEGTGDNPFDTITCATPTPTPTYTPTLTPTPTPTPIPWEASAVPVLFAATMPPVAAPQGISYPTNPNDLNWGKPESRLPCSVLELNNYRAVLNADSSDMTWGRFVSLILFGEGNSILLGYRNPDGSLAYHNPQASNLGSTCYRSDNATRFELVPTYGDEYHGYGECPCQWGNEATESEAREGISTGFFAFSYYHNPNITPLPYFTVR